MTGYVLRRVAYLVPVLLALSVLAFGMIEIAPGDPARVILQQQTGQPLTDAEVAAFRERMGFADPFVVRYVRWLRGAVTGDLGRSLRTGEPVFEELATRSLVTLEVALPAFLLGLAVALVTGTIAAVRRNRVADHASRLAALVGASMPSFWLAYLLILAFAVELGVAPVSGRGGWDHLILPTVTLAVGAAAALMRLARASLLDVLGEPFIKAARARGIPPRRTVLRHGMKNGLIPVVTFAGIRFGHLLGGAVIIETVFAWPGLGKHVVDSIHGRDFPTIQGFVLFIGAAFVLLNLAVDVLYVRLDPRVRLGAGAERTDDR
ncbi:MAG: ABC transporter permease [Chloroflexota bacterium]|nr:ABC transporter permease [Chloroflexota bacterium]